MNLTTPVLEYIDAHQQEAIDLLVDLAQIPAPSHQEQLRAEFYKKWLEKQGAEGVYIDDALNVIYPIGIDDDKPILVFAAHSDVVTICPEMVRFTTMKCHSQTAERLRPQFVS